MKTKLKNQIPSINLVFYYLQKYTSITKNTTKKETLNKLKKQINDIEKMENFLFELINKAKTIEQEKQDREITLKITTTNNLKNLEIEILSYEYK